MTINDTHEYLDWLYEAKETIMCTGRRESFLAAGTIRNDSDVMKQNTVKWLTKVKKEIDYISEKLLHE